MRYYLRFLILLAALLWYFPAGAQENITITTYYPSPYGSYNDLNIHRDLFVKDRTATTNAQVTVNSDVNGNFIVGANRPFYQIVFDDVDKPFSYFIPYGVGGVTYCANGYVAVNFLTLAKQPANPSALPASGYIVCLRGWE